MPGALRGAGHDANAPHGVAGLFNPDVLSHVLGNSSRLTYGKPTGPTSYGDWKFPVIQPGEATTIIPVAFPLTAAPTNPAVLMTEELELVVVFFVALAIWMLPTQCINKRMCCLCFRRWISKRLGCYFILGLILNITVISFFIAKAEHLDANAIFFVGVKFVEKVTASMMNVVIQLAALGALIFVWLARKKIMTVLGFDQQIIKADLRDLLTGFSMKRFRPIEVCLWQADDLPVGFSTRTMFTRVTLGYNEAAHTRPQDGCMARYQIKHRIQLNYDPEDDTQKMSIMVKMQEVIGASINQLLPVAGAAVGAVGGIASPIGPTTGAALGVVTGTGAANSVGQEVARVDLSSAMINRIRERCQNDSCPNPSSERPRSSQRGATSTGPTTPWSDQYFQKVDLIPQGHLWLRIADIEGAE